jgi:16S rRNA (guanine966-N2)-methyltransferase
MICQVSFATHNNMRIISGKYRGRKLLGPSGLELRPTGDRLKETLFNVFGSGVNGAVVLDVFGGSGAIGIEALSRGARQAVFIEKAASACRLIRRNAEMCGVSSGYRIVQQDVFMALRYLAREGFKANIVFFDPPYDFQPYGDLLDITFTRGLLVQPARVVIEHHRKGVLPDSGKGYRRSRLIRQGDHCLSFYEEDRIQESEAGMARA